MYIESKSNQLLCIDELCMGGLLGYIYTASKLLFELRVLCVIILCF